MWLHRPRVSCPIEPLQDSAGQPVRLRCGPWRGNRLPCEIETVGHVVRLGIVLVQVWQTERRLTKFEQTHMRVERCRDVPTLGVGAQDETADARPIAELRAVPGWMVPVSFGMMGIMPPQFDIRR